MKTVNSLSGGQTSSYIAANYPADYSLFALVRIEDKKCLFPDKKIRQEVEDRIQKPFIATAEDDLIIYTMLDLEQYIGKPIQWVSGITYDEVIRKKGGWLPNKLHRYCTSWLKIDPMFYWWAENIGEPVEMRLGFRASEQSRADNVSEKLNEKGLLVYNATFQKNTRGQNKWEQVEWQKPSFPLIKDRIFKDTIQNYWQDKPVRFAPLNNCVGCFHRNPLLLRKMFELHPDKMNWFSKQEQIKKEKHKKACWRSDISYEQIKKHKLQHEIDFSDFSGCDTGVCEVA